MSVINLNRNVGESESEYIRRIGEMKDAGVIGFTWGELADIFNRNLREDGVEYGESAYRKKYASIKKYNDEFGYRNIRDEIEQLKELKRELEKEKVKIRDERNEYRRIIREEARKESYKENFINAVIEAINNNPIEFYDCINYCEEEANGDADLIIPITDVHAGLEVDNFWNKYNDEILKKRIQDYIEKIFEIQKRHNCSNAYVVCSELLSGIIHPTLRIENNKDLIDQFLTATNYLCSFLIALSYKFNNVNLYVAPGNHSRINPKKEQDLAHENMDNLIIPFVSAKLQNYKNIHCFDNIVEQGFAMFSVRNHNVVVVHGDKDSPQNIADHLRGMYNDIKFDICIMGHRHTNAMVTDNDMKIVQSGCFSGTDSYAVDIRKHNRPEQTICVVTEKCGLDCVYDVKL